MGNMVRLGKNLMVSRYALMEVRLTGKDYDSGGSNVSYGRVPSNSLKPNILHPLSREESEDLYIQTAFKREGLKLSSLDGLGTPAVGEDGKVYFLIGSLVDKLSERGIEPQDFHLYERIAELYSHTSRNKAVTFLAEEENRIPLKLDLPDGKRTIRLSKSDGIKHLFMANYRDDPEESSHRHEHLISQLEKELEN
ncbi:hypothetical protein J4480_02945 [Candidatus Woesearchaeota archaeon]|nr:hypothetical protein [Candidatus Woesearchaeota archaeon]